MCPITTDSLLLAKRLQDLTSEGAYETAAAAAALEQAGHRILHLEIGEPDAPTPTHIINAGIWALRDGATRYASPPGIAPLRAAIAQWIKPRGIDVGPEQVLIGPGAKPLIFGGLLATAEPGTEVLVPDPGFPAYASVTAFAGATPVGYRVHVGAKDVIDVAEVASKITPRTRVLVLNSPHNPTGTVIARRTLEDLAELVLKHQLFVISDEIYQRFVFGVTHESIAAIPELQERTLVVDGFSKAYSMTGWRLGFGIVPRFLVEPLSRIIVNSVSCTNTATQHAGIAALTGPQDAVERYVAEIERRRTIVANLLRNVPGVEVTLPEGAFYAFPKVTGLLDRLGLDTAELAHRLLNEAHVACLAGTAFGSGGDGYLRLSLASSERTLVEACQRIQRWVAAQGAALARS